MIFTAISFRYKQIERPTPLEPIKAPTVSLTFAGKEKVGIIGILDSGADVSAIPMSIADILGLDLSKEKEQIVGVSGKTFAIKTSLTATVERGHEKYTFPLAVYVLDASIDGDFPILIGRKDFFYNFNITFKEKEGRIILKKVN